MSTFGNESSVEDHGFSDWPRYKKISATVLAFVGFATGVYAYNRIDQDTANRVKNNPSNLVSNLNRASGGANILELVHQGDVGPDIIKVNLPNCDSSSVIGYPPDALTVNDINGMAHVIATDHNGFIKRSPENETAMDVAKAICGQFVDLSSNP